MLYTLLTDVNRYSKPVIDSEHITKMIGEVSEETIELHIELNNTPRFYEGVFPEPPRVTFPRNAGRQKDLIIPEISVLDGRLLLNMRAYEVLASLIEKDGEFLPVALEDGEGWIFTPLRVAEDAGAVNSDWCSRGPSGDPTCLAIHEELVKGWSVFRTEFENYRGVHCQNRMTRTIRRFGLKGLYITPEIGWTYPVDRLAAPSFP